MLDTYRNTNRPLRLHAKHRLEKRGILGKMLYIFGFIQLNCSTWAWSSPGPSCTEWIFGLTSVLSHSFPWLFMLMHRKHPCKCYAHAVLGQHSESLQTEQSFCTYTWKGKVSLVLSPKFSPVEPFKLSKALPSLSIGADEIKLTSAVFLKRAHRYPGMHQQQELHQPLLPLLFLHLYFALLCFFFFFFLDRIPH